MKGGYFDNLAGVRGMAAIVVLISHVVQVHFLRFTGLETPLHRTSSVISEYAVVVFFILSGYLIAHTLEMNIKRNGRLRLDLYAAARIARLAPPFLYAIGLSLLVFLVMDYYALPGRSAPMRLPGDLYAARDIIHLSFDEIKQALLMRQGMLEVNGPLWSLYIEAKLYVLFAVALAAIDSGRGFTSKLLLAVVFYYVGELGVALNPSFAHYAAVWLTGALAYYALQDVLDPKKKKMLFCGSLIAIFVLEETLRIDALPWDTARDLVIAAVIAWLLFKRRMHVPVAKSLAECSYSLYVTHFPVLLLAQSLLISTGSVSLEAAIVVAVLSSVCAIIVALIGGRIETRKLAIQNGLLALPKLLCRIQDKA
jgi:peptidoglycan/LPS O-acetylase OafA/YrhL